jgi:hypothetical protein
MVYFPFLSPTSVLFSRANFYHAKITRDEKTAPPLPTIGRDEMLVLLGGIADQLFTSKTGLAKPF